MILQILAPPVRQSVAEQYLCGTCVFSALTTSLSFVTNNEFPPVLQAIVKLSKCEPEKRSSGSTNEVNRDENGIELVLRMVFHLCSCFKDSWLKCF